MSFEFYYEIDDDIQWDKDIEYRINRQRHKEREYYDKYGKLLDKSRIPTSNYCNNENVCCPYCVSDACLLYGVLLESKIGFYGFSFQKRNNRCLKANPKGKNLSQRTFFEGAKGGEGC